MLVLLGSLRSMSDKRGEKHVKPAEAVRWLRSSHRAVYFDTCGPVSSYYVQIPANACRVQHLTDLIEAKGMKIIPVKMNSNGPHAVPCP